MDTTRIQLTDLPTTWEEYQMYRMSCTLPHNAFILALIDDELSKVRHNTGRITRNPPMLRQDFFNKLTNCLPTVLSNMGAKWETRGYQLPFESTFDETDDKYGILTTWTLQELDGVISFAVEILSDATACEEAIRQEGENESKELMRDGLPHLDLVIARMVCAAASAMAGKLVSALRVARKHKVSYAELIITCCIDVPINGEVFQLYEVDGSYFYINNDGDKNIPF
jgi:hypothetical protein